MFDETAYSVKEGMTVDVMIQLCGNISADENVMVSVMTDGTAGTALVIDTFPQ